jgi:hypothetical protein
MTFKIRNSNFSLDCSLARINPHVTRVAKTKKVMMQSHYFSYAVTTLITLYYLSLTTYQFDYQKKKTYQFKGEMCVL